MPFSHATFGNFEVADEGKGGDVLLAVRRPFVESVGQAVGGCIGIGAMLA